MKEDSCWSVEMFHLICHRWFAIGLIIAILTVLLFKHPVKYILQRKLRVLRYLLVAGCVLLESVGDCSNAS